MLYKRLHGRETYYCGVIGENDYLKKMRQAWVGFVLGSNLKRMDSLLERYIFVGVAASKLIPHVVLKKLPMSNPGDIELQNLDDEGNYLIFYNCW